MPTTLQQAAQAVLDRWDSPAWTWAQSSHTGELMHALRLAIEAQPVPSATSCACKFKGDVCESRCQFHEAWHVAIHDWAERAKIAEAKLTQPVPPTTITWNADGVRTVNGIPDYVQPVPSAERNFCETCGKRLSDSEYIHTCTPPESKA